MTTKQITIAEQLEQDGSIGFYLAIAKRFGSMEISDYTEICGSYIDGVYQWKDHNINYTMESQNSKYFGWTIHFNDGRVRRVYIPIWVMNCVAKNWTHAKNLFNKYLLEDSKFNNATENQSHNYYAY